MIGPDAIKVPGQDQHYGAKQVSDLIGDNISIKWDGVKGKVTGDIKYVEDYSDLFGEDDKAGNFFPVLLTVPGEEIKTTNGDVVRTNAYPDDNQLVAKIRQKTDHLKIEVDNREVADLDFSGAEMGAAKVIRAARSKKVVSTS